MKRLHLTALALGLALALGGFAACPGVAEETGYVGCSASDDCIPFDLETYANGTAIEILPEGNYPYDATMSPDGTEVWICGGSGDGVAVIDVASNDVTHRIPVEEYPNSVVFTDDWSKALVSARDGDLITIIDTSTYTVIGTLDATTGGGGIYDGPGNMALDPATGKIYAVDWYDDHLYEIAPDGSSVLRTALLGIEMWQLVVDPFGRHIYITDRETHEVRVIDPVTLTQERTVPVGADPWGIDVTFDGSTVVVACEDDASVHIIDTDTWTTTVVPLPAGSPRDVDIDDAQGYAFVPGGSVSGPDVVYVIELATNTIKSAFEITGGNPNVIAVRRQMTSATVGVAGGGETVQALRLTCSPNPFNPRTTVRYFVENASEVDLAVYDVAGRRVVTLGAGPRAAGEHEASWDGRTSDGRAAATGVYFVRLEAAGTTRTEKAVLLK